MADFPDVIVLELDLVGEVVRCELQGSKRQSAPVRCAAGAEDEVGE